MMKNFPQAAITLFTTISSVWPDQGHFTKKPCDLKWTSMPEVRARRAAVAFILITIALDTLALGMIIPVLPKLVEAFMGGNTARAAEVFGVFGIVWALMQFLFSPLLGALSDRFGRRPVIILSNAGLGLDYVVMALAPTLGWLFVGRVISGITSASISAAYAYIADVTPPERRAASYGLLGAAFGIGFILGPALGGVFGAIEPRLPFWVAAAFSLANAAYGFFVLPESLAPDQRSGFAWRRANPIGSFALLRSHPELFGLAAANFLINLSHVVFPTVFVLYAGYRYGWNESRVGLSMALFGLCSMGVQAGLVGPVVQRLGERCALVLGLVMGTLGLTIFALAPTDALFWSGIPVMALWGFATPALQGLMTRLVAPSEQGRLQGANSSIVGIGNVIGPGIFALAFASATEAGRDFSGAPFLLSALMLVAAAVLAWVVTRRHAAAP
jgi:DHA1 family tetracycline resistance protein-like MFS transporter